MRADDIAAAWDAGFHSSRTALRDARTAVTRLTAEQDHIAASWVDAPSSAQPRGFAGKEHDEFTGFDYFGGRYLLADASGFTTVDPVLDIDSALVDPQRWNRYTYVANRPLVWTDPDGRCIWDGCAGEIALYLGASYAAVVSTEAALATAVVLSPIGKRMTNGIANTVSAVVVGASNLVAGDDHHGKRGGEFGGRAQSEATVRQGRSGTGGRTRSPHSSQIDHKTAWAKRGRTNRENAANSCRTCNLSKGSKELGKEWVPPKLRPRPIEAP